jgi:hypothetical protein
MNCPPGTDIGTCFLGPNHFLSQISGGSTLISLFLSNSIVIAGVILIFILVFSGYSFIGAGGNPQKVQAAAKMATYGIAGFLLVFATYFIIKIIESITALNIL